VNENKWEEFVKEVKLAKRSGILAHIRHEKTRKKVREMFGKNLKVLRKNADQKDGTSKTV